MGRKEKVLEVENKQEKLVRIAINIPESKRDMIQKVVAKSSYNNVSEFVRAGIDKELDIQMYKDSLDFVVKELSKLIDMKLDGFISSQRKLYANNVRISAVNTYAVGEMMKRILGDEFHNDFIGIVDKFPNIQSEENLSSIINYIDDLAKAKVPIYRGLVSLTEFDAERLGYYDQEKWKKLLENRLPSIAEKLNIKLSDLQYLI